jgi:hypothetical protein
MSTHGRPASGCPPAPPPPSRRPPCCGCGVVSCSHARLFAVASFEPERWDGKHRFEHWYRNNQVYLITARTRGGTPAFETEAAKGVFRDRFSHYTAKHRFEPRVVSLLANHYYVVGYVPVGIELKEMMRKIHGSVAKLVNDLLQVRLVPFWGDHENRDYFDGCLRDETQLVRTYRYVLRQSVRHGVCADYRKYPHTRVYLTLEESVAFAREHRALMYGVPYARYERHREHRERRLRRGGSGSGT